LRVPTRNRSAARHLIDDRLRKRKACEPCGEETNIAKMLSAEASWAAGEAFVQTHGGFGFAAEYDVVHKYRETLLYQVAPNSTNMMLSYVADHVLGLPRIYQAWRNDDWIRPIPSNRPDVFFVEK